MVTLPLLSSIRRSTQVVKTSVAAHDMTNTATYRPHVVHVRASVDQLFVKQTKAAFYCNQQW